MLNALCVVLQDLSKTTPRLPSIIMIVITVRHLLLAVLNPYDPPPPHHPEDHDPSELRPLMRPDLCPGGRVLVVAWPKNSLGRIRGLYLLILQLPPVLDVFKKSEVRTRTDRGPRVRPYKYSSTYTSSRYESYGVMSSQPLIGFLGRLLQVRAEAQVVQRVHAFSTRL